MSKKKFSWRQCAVFILMILIGGICGVLMGKSLSTISDENTSVGQDIISLILLLAGIYLSIFLQLVIHEAGHLVFGKLSGYKFSSFRIGNLMWLNDNGKLKMKRLSIAGTAGQCLMSPPEIIDGKLPIVLYNLGGSLLNIISCVVFMLLYFLCSRIPLLPIFFLTTALIGFAVALTNGIPMRLGTIDNDGYNALSLTKSNEAMRSFWIQMKVNELLSKNIRVKDMPDEWFTVPSDESMKNSMCSVIGVFACGRLIDQHRFEDADALMEHLLEIDSGIVGLHRSLMICDRIYCELIGSNRSDKLDSYLTKAQRKFIKTMKNYPSVLRTEYTLSLLSERNSDKASKFKKLFEKCAATYPYQSDIEAERELIDIADKAACM